VKTDKIVELKKLYKTKSKDIKQRLEDFKETYKNGTDEEILSELSFCLLTPQSKAKMCWNSICSLSKDNLIIIGDKDNITKKLFGVRFKYKKAEYIICAREHFIKNNKVVIKDKIDSFEDILSLRDWLVKNIKGYGYKEASHFLRNIGMGEDIAILDRHILRNLVRFGVIDKIPTSISKSKYLEIEDLMRIFSMKLNIPLSHIDILFWSNETGEIFK
jgi:N-glycosylase/DNA lyase